jgi:hypothetical protein
MYRDHDGVLTDHKREDEIVPFTWDLTDELAETSGTISSVSYEENGVTVSGNSNTNTAWTCNITGLGTLEVTVTDSNSRKYQEVFQWNADDNESGKYA